MSTRPENQSFAFEFFALKFIGYADFQKLKDGFHFSFILSVSDRKISKRKPHTKAIVLPLVLVIKYVMSLISTIKNS